MGSNIASISNVMNAEKANRTITTTWFFKYETNFLNNKFKIKALLDWNKNSWRNCKNSSILSSCLQKFLLLAECTLENKWSKHYNILIETNALGAMLYCGAEGPRDLLTPPTSITLYNVIISSNSFRCRVRDVTNLNWATWSLIEHSLRGNIGIGVKWLGSSKVLRIWARQPSLFLVVM